jgi:hypothetical protein
MYKKPTLKIWGQTPSQLFTLKFNKLLVLGSVPILLTVLSIGTKKPPEGGF